MLKHKTTQSSVIVYLNPVFDGTEVMLVIRPFRGFHFLLGEFNHFNVRKSDCGLCGWPAACSAI